MPTNMMYYWLSFLVTWCSTFSLGAARVGGLSPTSLLMSDVNPHLLEMVVGLQENVDQLVTEMMQMQQQIEMLMTATSKDSSKKIQEETNTPRDISHATEASESAAATTSTTTKTRERALQTMNVTTDEFNMYKNSIRAELNSLWTLTNKTASKGDKTAVSVDTFRILVNRQSNATNIRINSLTTRVIILERRVNNMTNLTFTLSTDLDRIEGEMDNSTAVLDQQLDSTVHVIGNLSTILAGSIKNNGVNLQNQLNATDAALAALSTQMDNVNRTVSAIEGDLQNQVSATNVAVSALSADLGNLDSKISNLNSDLNATRGNIQGQINATSKTIGNLSSLVSSMNADLSTTRGDLQSQLNATSKSIGNLSTLISNLNVDLNATSKTVGNLSSLVSSMNTDLSTTRGDLQSQVNATKQSIGNLSTLINNLNNDLNTTRWNLQSQINALNQTVQAANGPCFYSCKQAYNSGYNTSGVYQLCPSSGSTTNVLRFSAYCDQTTDGGGWMLFFAYSHIGGENKTVQPGTAPPTSPTNGFSHINLNSIGYNSTTIQDLRFYCETNLHPRKMHFKTSNTVIKNIATTGNQAGNVASLWTSGYTTFSDHTANLPAATLDAVSSSATGGLGYFPFYRGANYHWSVGAESRWECDDWAAGPAYTTRHNIWARAAS